MWRETKRMSFSEGKPRRFRHLWPEASRDHMKGIRMALAVFGLAFCLAIANAQLSPLAGTILSAMDPTIDPCVDFYSYSCGGWLDTHEIPGDKSGIDRAISVISDRNMDTVLNIVQNASSGLVNSFYSACMDTTQIEADGAAPLLALWNSFLPVNSNFDNLGFNLGILFKNGLSALYGFGTVIDSDDPTKNIYALGQGGLTLPDSSYYYDDSIYPLYVAHIATMFQIAGVSGIDAAGIASFEKALANVTVPPDQLFDPFSTFNKMDWSRVIHLAPHVKFSELMLGLSLNMGVSVTVDAPKYFKDMNIVLGQTSPVTVMNYLRWRALHWLAPRMNAAFVTANFEFFGTVLSGLSIPTARSKTCVQATSDAMPELVGRLYAQVAFPPSSKSEASAIFASIISAFEINVHKLDWMDPVTSQKAIGKLEMILRLIGYPDNPRNYTSYGPQFGSHYVKNILVATQDEFNRDMASAGGPSNRLKWEMPAWIVNAYYDPSKNEIVFPAGIIQSPYFDPTFPTSMNYGGIGMVGGHELSHSLDSQGRDYDGTGKLVDWWAPRTSEAFQQRVDCIIDQYSKFSPLPGFYVNGNLTQGENIADTGGLKTSHSAYLNLYPQEAKQPSIVPGLDNEQLFFVGFAQTWCSKQTPATIRNRLLTDPHSPPRFRVLGPLINLPAFAQSFQCPVGSPMNPPQRCQIW